MYWLQESGNEVMYIVYLHMIQSEVHQLPLVEPHDNSFGPRQQMFYAMEY